MAAEDISTSYVNLTTVGPTAISGSEIWDALEYIEITIADYWTAMTSAYMHHTENAQITGVIELRGNSSTSSVNEGPIGFTAVNLGGGYWKANITGSLSATAIGWRFEWSGGSYTLGYTGYSSAIAENPVNLPSTFSDSWAILIGTNGLNGILLTEATMIKNTGWVTRFFQPYIGLKEAINLYGSMIWSQSGYEENYPYDPITGGDVSAIIPINTISYHTYFVESYYNADEYLYRWDTLITGGYLESISAAFSDASNNVYDRTANDSLLSATGDLSYTRSSIFASGGYDTGTLDRHRIYTGPDNISEVDDFRIAHQIASLRSGYDKDHVTLPQSAISGIGQLDNSSKNVFNYLMKDYSIYDVVREFL